MKRGDIVQIRLDNNDIVYLETVEVSAILSKLGPVKNGPRKTSSEVFKLIKIGNTVEKVTDTAPPVVVHSTAPVGISEIPAALNPVLENSIRRLESELAAAQDEIKGLQTKNAALEEKVTQLTAGQESLNLEKQNYEARLKASQELIASLKNKLENMKKIVSNNER